MNIMSFKSFRLATISIALGHLPVVGLHAALPAYDGFDYTAGVTILNTPAGSGNGGTGWTTNWTGSGLATVQGSSTAITYSADGNTYGGGNTVSVSGGGTQNAAARSFSSSTLTTGSDVYFSFLVNVTGGTTGTAISSGSFISVSLLDTAFSTSSDNGIILNGSSLGARVANATQSATSTLNYGTTYLVVGRFSGWDNTTNTYQQTSVWLNPTNSDFVNTTFGTNVATTSYASSSVASSTTLGSDGLRGVTLRTNALGSNVYLFDDLRIGTTWNDVVLASVPEPSATTAVLAMAAFAAAMATRRRR